MGMYEIHAEDVQIGQGVVIEDDVVLQGRKHKKAKRIVIGDNVFIGQGTRAFVDELELGDYVTLHNHAFIAGDLPCRIGHCSWFGQHTILNSTGGLTIGNGVGIGAYSQLWTHIRHGDVLQGCRFNSTKAMVIEDDVWFVGHCIVSPIVAKRRSMALVGAVVTRDMEDNHVYAGVPASDVTAKVGPQFAEVALGDKLATMRQKLDHFYAEQAASARTLAIAGSPDEAGALERKELTAFDVSSRSYNRRRTEQEFAFMKFLLHDIKFFPRS
jgi:acetyltransferase-like isoleucine patch superfamily enzyme